ncbi:hypothetical protein L798_14656 [Zootermopsis nevadensis]|uniref:Uncharacterized protein n=1 Tax=Zootermopsis nevadensis TaxID=136037 RepID=A0A067QY12_ZOONE|nr:hypothetical protein L798_14656 [Zootermopsis nevadensis]
MFEQAASLRSVPVQGRLRHENTHTDVATAKQPAPTLLPATNNFLLDKRTGKNIFAQSSDFSLSILKLEKLRCKDKPGFKSFMCKHVNLITNHSQIGMLTGH